MKLISGTLCRGIIYFKHLCPVKEDIIFIWLREKLTTVTGLMFLCLLAMIQNWELKVGLGKQMKCLEKVKKNNKARDGVDVGNLQTVRSLATHHVFGEGKKLKMFWEIIQKQRMAV